MAKEQIRTYVRFSLAHRIEHAILMISFTVLALTGLPQKYVGHPWAETLILLLGGIERVRLTHHIAAVTMLADSILHLVSVGYRLFVLGAQPSIMPRLKDAWDMIQDVGYNLCLLPRPSMADRYTYREKMEYWAVVWGTLIMAVTGFMMWNPIATTRYLPGEAIPAAKAAHGGEAVLATLAILTWHVYHAHLKHFNKSMFTGRLTEEEMRHEHPLELQRLKEGKAPLALDPETRRRRAMLYIPVATIVSAMLVAGLYVFVTFEQTAITTMPPEPTIEPYAPETFTPTPPGLQTQGTEVPGQAGDVTGTLR